MPPKSKPDLETTSRDWIKDFVKLTENINSPEIFRQWAGIMTISGALERKVWVHTKGSPLYPNLYVFLVATPGIGKTELTFRVREMWEKRLETHHIASTSVTKAALVDELAAGERRVVRMLEQPPVVNFNSLLIAVDELGVLIPAYDTEFLNTLTHLYDCRTYSESRRTSVVKEVKIKNPHVTMFAACTPGYLRETLPAVAWDQGFLSRVIFIYSGATKPESIFAEKKDDAILEEKLLDRLEEIGALYGKFTFTPESKEFIDYWHLNGQKPQPEHPRLAHYNTRRTAHLLKLSQIASVSFSDELVIELEHAQQALNWLVEAEFYMADIFKAMRSGGDGQTIEETYHFIYTTYMKEKKPVAENRIILFLQARTPVHNIVRIIDIMDRAKMISQSLEKGVGTCWKPLTKL